MIKLITMMRKKDGISHVQFREHEERTHVPLVRGIMGDDLKGYIRNYPSRDEAAAFRSGIDFDLIVESYFEDRDAFRRAVAAADRPENRAKLKADYARYLDLASVQQSLVEVEAYVDADPRVTIEAPDAGG